MWLVPNLDRGAVFLVAFAKSASCIDPTVSLFLCPLTVFVTRFPVVIPYTISTLLHYQGRGVDVQMGKGRGQDHKVTVLKKVAFDTFTDFDCILV